MLAVAGCFAGLWVSVFSDPDGTFDWGYMAPDSGHLGLNRG